MFSELSFEISEEKINGNQLEISEDNKFKEGNFSDNQNIIKLQRVYMNEFNDYKSNSNKFKPKCSLYVYEETHSKKQYQKYLLLRLEIRKLIN